MRAVTDPGSGIQPPTLERCLPKQWVTSSKHGKWERKQRMAAMLHAQKHGPAAWLNGPLFAQRLKSRMKSSASMQQVFSPFLRGALTFTLSCWKR